MWLTFFSWTFLNFLSFKEEIGDLPSFLNCLEWMNCQFGLGVGWFGCWHDQNDKMIAENVNCQSICCSKGRVGMLNACVASN